MNKNSANIIKFEKKYSESNFFQKIGKNIYNLAGNLLQKVLVLYYIAKDKDTPKWAKSVIFGALGYFIFPLDAIPDFIPAVGYSDDLTAIITAFAAVAMYYKPVHLDLAKSKINNLFHSNEGTI